MAKPCKRPKINFFEGVTSSNHHPGEGDQSDQIYNPCRWPNIQFRKDELTPRHHLHLGLCTRDQKLKSCERRPGDWFLCSWRVITHPSKHIDYLSPFCLCGTCQTTTNFFDFYLIRLFCRKFTCCYIGQFKLNMEAVSKPREWPQHEYSREHSSS